MATSQGPTSAAYRAGDVARRLEQGWIGTEHVLLALFDEPSVATEALEELGVTRELVEETARGYSDSDPPPPSYDPEQSLSPNPAWYKLTGCATGLALASGRRHPGPEHLLLAMVYDEHAVSPLLRQLGSSERALVDALARRGVPVPEVDPPVFRPWRGFHRIEVTEAELKPVIDVLSERYPPGSGPEWGFNWLGDPEAGGPRRAWVGGEEGVDLDAAFAAARTRARSRPSADDQ
jgi:Clp amino terminal domain, pathogenicity island component